MKKDDKKNAKDSNLAIIIAYVILAVIVIYLIVSSSKNAEFQKEVKTTLDKQLNSVVSDFSEKEKLISANIASCSTDVSCDSLFKIKNYTCDAGLKPVCLEKFCKCK